MSLNKELSKLEEANRLSKLSRFRSRIHDKPTTDEMTDEQKETLKAECEQKAYNKIAKLLGKEYADMFFKEKLYETTSTGYDNEDEDW